MRTISVRATLVAGALVWLGSGPLAAQEPWKASYYPYLVKGPNDQLSFVMHYQYGQAADYMDRVPFTKSLSLEGGINGSGSRFACADVCPRRGLEQRRQGCCRRTTAAGFASRIATA